ncbi:MAG: hypothetical protein H0V76_04115 [Blastocatellia bacterium]|nr:hypothetical protein [Blastocatellia bacterium]
MMKALIFIGILLAGSTPAAFGQFEQMRRVRERLDRSVEAARAREAGTEGERANASALPQPKPAVMNVDVQAVITRTDHASFAEAKPAAVSRIGDGDQLWLFVKFNGKLGDYVRTLPDPENPGEFRYLLFAEIAPQGDISALSQYVLQFRKDDLALPELKINLSPGLPGRNSSMPVLLSTVAEGKPGVWNNEFRLTNVPAVPRALTQNLVSTPVVFDFTSGVSKYPRLNENYYSMVLRGTDDTARMPIAGSFYSLPVKTEITAELKEQGITPVRLYFASEQWEETSTSTMNMSKTRRVFAGFTYKVGEACEYGVAEASQKFDFMASRYLPTTVSVKKGFPIGCDKLN